MLFKQLTTLLAEKFSKDLPWGQTAKENTKLPSFQVEGAFGSNLAQAAALRWGIRTGCYGPHLSLGQKGWRQLTRNQLMDGEQFPPKPHNVKMSLLSRHITEDLQFAPRWAKLGSWCKTCVQLYFPILLTCILTNLSTYKSNTDAQKNQIKLS